MKRTSMTYEERLADATRCYNAGLHRVKTTPPPKGQKYPPGTRVMVTGGGWHSGKLATVEYTYAHAYGGNDVKDYALRLDGSGFGAWFEESVLTPIEAAGNDGGVE
jgi:hypothetical protein